MTGDGTWKTITDTGTDLTVLEHRGTGAGTTVRISAHTGILTGAAGAIAHGDITVIMTLGTGEDITEAGTVRTTPDTGAGTTHGTTITTTAAGMTHTITTVTSEALPTMEETLITD